MKKNISILVIMVVLSILFSGCSIEYKADDQQEHKAYDIYYVDSSETKLEREEYFPEEETTKYLLQSFTDKLNGKTHKKAGVALLPENVSIDSYKLEETHLIIKFNKEYSQMSMTREILVRAGTVKTYLQIPDINSVEIMIGNEELTNSKGQIVGPMHAASFAEFSSADTDAYTYDTFTLYFTDESGEKLIEEQRNVYYKRNLPIERVVLEQLAKGPMKEGHYPTIPQETEVLSVTKADNACYIEFNDKFITEQLNISSEVILYSVVNSITSATGAEKVEISISGKTDVMFAGEYSLYNFYQWNDSLVEKEKTKKET